MATQMLPASRIWERFSSTWYINRISSLSINTIQKRFFAPENTKLMWKMICRPYKMDDEGKHYITFAISLFSTAKAPVNVMFLVFFRNTGDQKIAMDKSIKFPCEVGEGWEVMLIIPRYDLLQKLKDDVLKICVIVRILRDDLRGRSEIELNSASLPELKLSSDLGALLENPIFSDLVICVEGEDIPAHKTILAARSKVFAAMFQHDSMENKHGRINISDFRSSVIRLLLRFIYTGRVTFESVHTAMKLMEVADKYDLEDLTAECSHFISQNLDVINVADVLVLAYVHYVEKLKNKALDYIVANRVAFYEMGDYDLVESLILADIKLKKHKQKL